MIRDDRVLPLTKQVSAAVIPVLTAAFVILYLFPSRTEQLWAWTLKSQMSAMLMGGGYIAGVYFFLRAVTGRRWHRVGVGFVAITAFATLLGITTIIHWENFNHDHISFWAWSALYFSTPLLLPLLWLRNRRFDPGAPEPGDRIVPGAIRAVVAAVGFCQLALVVSMAVRPSLFLDAWPWPLTPLTTRSLAGFAAFPAVAYAAFAFEKRWSALRIPIETAMIGMALIGVAAVRAADEFGGNDVIVWGWRVGLILAFSLLLSLHVAMGAADA